MPDSSVAFDFPAGSQVAGYRLDEPVGRSGTSVLFRAFDEARGEPVAVQLIVPELAADEAFRDRFVRATLAAGRVDEPHIIPIFAVGQAGGVLYVAMRYVTGGDAGALVRRLGALPPPRVLQLITAAATALDAVHAAGIVHGGVSPAALLLDKLPGGEEHLYLADFGLAPAAMSTIATGHLPLTLDYAAPEQILRRPVDGRADQYALACSAVQLLSGAAPSVTAEPPTAHPGATGADPADTGHADAAPVGGSAPADRDPAGSSPAATDLADTAPAGGPTSTGPNPADTALVGGPNPTGPNPAGAAPAEADFPGTDPAPGAGATTGAGPAGAGPAGAGPAGAGPAGAGPAGAGPAGAEVPAGGRPAVATGSRRAALAGRLADLPADFPTAVYAVLSQALATAPDDRYSSCGEFAAALRTAFESQGAGSLAAAGSGRATGLAAFADPGRGTGPAPTPPDGIPVVAAGVPHAAPVPGATAVPVQAAPGAGRPKGSLATADATTAGTATADATTAGSTAGATAAGGQSGRAGGPVERAGNARRRGVPVAIAAAVILAGGGTAAGLILTRPNAPRAAALRAAGSPATSIGGGASATATPGQGGTAPISPAPTGRAPTSTGPSSTGPSSTGPSSTASAASSARGPASITRSFADPGGGGSRHVESVAVSPDGALLAAGDANGETLLWATGTGRLTATLRPATSATILGVGFSPNGALVAAGTNDGRTFLWSTTTGRLLGTAIDPGGRQVNAVAFSPDGTMLATADGNGEAFLWKVSGGGTVTLARTLADPLGKGIWSVAFSPDGATLAAGDYQGTTCLWRLAAGTGPVLLAGPSGQPAASALAISHDGSTLAAGYLDGSVYVWQLGAPAAAHAATRAIKVFAAPGSVWGAAFSDRGLLAIAAGNGSTYLVNPVTGAAAGTLTDPGTGSQGVGAVAFLPGGASLIAGDTNGTTYLWRLP